MAVTQSVINKPFDYDLYDKLEDCVSEMKQNEMDEEADNEGNWRPEEYFDGVAGDLLNVLETYFFDYDLFKILDIKYVTYSRHYSSNTEHLNFEYYSLNNKAI